MKKRLVLYILYNKDGIVDDYIIYCLKELKKIAEKVAVVSNCFLSEEYKKKILFIDKYFERCNTHFDVGAISDFLTNLMGWEEIYKFDELLIMNDSVFGPIYPFEEAINRMDSFSQLDFWGLTERAESDFDGGEEIYPEHIQSYFYVIRKKMLHSKEFRNYFETITDKITDFRSAIINYEFNFTQHFSELGYKWGVYACDENYATNDITQNLSPYHYEMYTLVKDYRVPLIKRKLFTGDFVNRQYSDRTDITKTFTYIKNNTNYNTDYIWQYILRNYNMRDMIAAMNLYEIVTPSEQEADKVNYDLVVISGDNITEKKLLDNSDKNGKYTLVINIPKQNNIPYALKESISNNILVNLAKNSAYILKIYELFENNSRLGLLVPPAESFGNNFFSMNKKWNGITAKQYYDELKLTVPFSSEAAPIHKINAFWCRNSILTDNVVSLLKKDNETAMRIMPLVAQNMGYYTSIVINSEYVPCILRNIYSETEDIINIYCNEIDMKNNLNDTVKRIYAEKIKTFCKNKSYIYIYGAGYLAQQIIKITQTIHKIDGIYVSDKNGNSKKVCGYNVKSIDEMEVTKDNIGVIVAVGEKNNKIVGNILANRNIDNLLFIN